MISAFSQWTKERWIFLTIILVLSSTTAMLFGVLQYDYNTKTAESQNVDVPTQHADLARAINSFGLIDNLIKQALIKYDASRVSILRIHFGPKDLSKMTTFSVSVANIVAKPGVIIAPEEITDLPASIFSSVLPGLVDRKPFIILTDNLPNDGLKEILTRRKTVFSEWIPVIDNDGNLIGILSADWTNVNSVPSASGPMVQDMQNIAKKISTFFSLPPIEDKPANEDHLISISNELHQSILK